MVNRAAVHEAFGRNLSYVVDRDLLTKMTQAWQDLVTKTILPLRYYESGAQLINVEGGRFAYGTTIEQVFTYASFDRIGNAQIISRIGIALGENTDAVLATTKPAWLDDAGLQGLRRLIEELLVEPDWALSNVGLDLCDRLIFPLLTAHLDEAALLGSAGAYSLLIQQLGVWWKDQRKWFDPLISAWVNDPEHGKANTEALQAMVAKRLPQITAAVVDLAQSVVQGVQNFCDDLKTTHTGTPAATPPSAAASAPAPTQAAAPTRKTLKLAPPAAAAQRAPGSAKGGPARSGSADSRRHTPSAAGAHSPSRSSKAA